ncbi:alanyl-tRNA editing protein AlaXM [soil metagenome]
MATDLLYQTDSYLRDFTAEVRRSDRVSRSVVLDRSAFYPTGGGQPADAGVLLWDGQEAVVSGARKNGSDVEHILDGDGPVPTAGARVQGIIDWTRRYRLMRTHSALHVLCGVVYRDFGALVTGGNMEIDRARMDFELDDLADSRVRAIESAANAEILACRDVRVRILPREEAFQIPDLIRTKMNLLPPGIVNVRTVEIVGLDLQADGGTHVGNTGEIGGIRITGTRSKGRINKRLEIELVDAP